MSNPKPTSTGKHKTQAQRYLELSGEARIRALIGAFAEQVKSPDDMVFSYFPDLLYPYFSSHISRLTNTTDALPRNGQNISSRTWRCTPWPLTRRNRR